MKRYDLDGIKLGEKKNYNLKRASPDRLCVHDVL